mmetsp:Transcript_5269/g.16131  ORF Transcript_5269/g.16131 Transcript_5269/m.16131 type:complete len:723 (+) Transcript_5269:707-2875(+)
MVLSPDAADKQTIVKATVCGSALVALTNMMNLQVCDDVRATVPLVFSMLSGLSVSRPAIAFAVVKPDLSSSGHLEVILSTNDNSVILVDSNGPEDQLLHKRFQTPIVDMSVAPNGRFLACLTAGGVLTVMSMSFSTKILEFDTASSPPAQMLWCGEDSVMLCWEKAMLLVGPYGHWLRFSSKRSLHVVAEADCCRVITDGLCEVVQRIPASTGLIHHADSTHLAAMLYDAIEDLPSATDANLTCCSLTVELQNAIDANIFSALAEFEPSKQKRYLRAAMRGEKQLPPPFSKTAEIVLAARNLRVLNHVRRARPGLFVTFCQYKRLSPFMLIDRLLVRNEHMLALHISQYLGMSQTPVLINWACTKLEQPLVTCKVDEQLRNELETCLVTHRCLVPYAQIAAAADMAGRRSLAKMLIQRETSTLERIKLLLGMQEYENALKEALRSMQIDLVYLALLSIDRARSVPCPNSDDLIYKHTDVPCLLRIHYRDYCWRDRRRLLHNSLVNSKSPSYVDAGNLAVKNGYREKTIEGRIMKFREAAALFAHSRASCFQAKQTEEELELLRLQHGFEERFGVSCFLGMSVTETLHNLFALWITHRQHVSVLKAQVDRLQRHFKVPERRLSYIKIQALAASGQWDEFHRFALERRPLVGYRPFVLALLHHSQPISIISTYFKLWQQAMETAWHLKDSEKLNKVRVNCNDVQLKKVIAARLAQLSHRLHDEA